MVTRYDCPTFICTPITTLLLLSVVTVATGQTQITLTPGKDNTLYESATGSLSNGAGAHFFAGRTSTPTFIRRGLLAFDVAGAIPAGATVTTVTLSLTMTQTSLGAGAQPISLHRVLADWGEGTSAALGNEGQGAPSATGDATWIHTFFNTIFWTTPGGDFVPSASATQRVDTLGPYTWGSTSQMVSDVQEWLTNPAGNFGWILVGNEDSSQTSKRFASRQNAQTTARPQLTITYLPPAGVETDDPEVHEFSLSQNYPNPFNPTTTITYYVPSTGYVTLIVYDVLGREVTTLANGERSPGTYTVEWNATGMAGSVYLYRLQAVGFVETRRSVLLR